MLLSSQHREHLRASGLSDAIIEAAGIYSARDSEIAEILTWQPKDFGWGTGIVFPFRKPNGEESGYRRVRLDFPRTAEDGGVIKYESPVKQVNRAYFPPATASALNDASTALLITEGEKKSLKATQEGFTCIGLVGVWGWQARRNRDDRGRAFGARKFLSDLAVVNWKGREVLICFDSDAATKPMVQLAEARLAEALTKLGAAVKVVRLPQSGDDKVGLDDFLVAHGPNEFRKLITEAKAAEVPETPGPMDTGRELLEDLFRDHSGQLTLRWWRDEFYRWTGRHYVVLSDSELRAGVLEWLAKRDHNARPKQASEVFECLRTLCRVPFNRDIPTMLDDQGSADSRNIIAFDNALVTISDVGGKIVTAPHSPGWFSRTSLPYKFNPSADCPAWLDFLHRTLEDHDKLDLLQEFFGICLIDDTSWQKILLLVGPPRAGKGVVCRMLTHTIGRANVANPTLSGLATEFGLWPLMGRSVAILTDAHLSRRGDDVRALETIKAISGEDDVTVNRKNLPLLTNVKLKVRFVITVNELPHFNDPSGALAARLLIVPFEKSWSGREDRTLERRIMAEAPGVLNWGLGGLHRLRTRGVFTIPAKSEEIARSYRRLTSPAAAFLEDVCETGTPGLTTDVEVLFHAHNEWAEQNGHAKVSRNTLGEKLRAADPRIRIRRKGKNEGRRRFYQSVGLTVEGLAMAEEWTAKQGKKQG